MYINEAKVAPKPLRWCYFADCFRYERPQKGRYRQFWQFGVELIGADTALADAEVIMLAADMLNPTGVTYELKVGHLSFMKNLLKDLEPQAQRKVMAHLDKKDYDGLKATLGAMDKPDLGNSLISLVQCHDLSEAFEIAGAVPGQERIQQTIGILDAAGINYSLNFGIARGLDYYTGMVFEGFAENLGAENQILGGGTYRLAHLFGGDDVASCGFAIGFDRVMVSLGETQHKKDTVVAIACTSEGRNHAMEVARTLRNAGIRTEMDLMERGLGAQLAHAAKSADFAIVIGQREAESKHVTLKNLHSGEQKTLDLPTAIAEVASHGAGR
jgi:histidyl-tRNA synthetase